MTLPQLEALEERRMTSVRYARFNASLVAAILYNSRPGVEEPVDVWDFIPGFARSPEEVEDEKQRRSIKESVLVAFSRMGHMTAGQVRREAAAMIQRMKDAGIDAVDAESIVREVFEQVTQQPYTE